MAYGIGRHQIAVTAIVAGATQHQNPARLRPVAYQPAKRTGGCGLHQVKSVNPLLINYIAINLPHRIGGVEVFW